jgi:TolA-binding protein
MKMHFLVFLTISVCLGRLDGTRAPAQEIWPKTTLKGHSGAVLAVAFSPDGKTLASGGGATSAGTQELGEIILWDLTTAKKRAALTGHDRTVLSIAFAPNGNTLASASRDTTVRIWDVATGQARVTLAGHAAEVNSVAFSPDGKTLASASKDKTVRLWDLPTAKERSILRGHADAVTVVAFSPDGNVLASASLDKTVRLWDLATAKERCQLKMSDTPTSLAFSPDGRFLAAGAWPGSAKLWEVATGEGRVDALADSSGVSSVAFSTDGKLLALGRALGTVALVDVAAGNKRLDLRGDLHGSGCWVFSLAFSPDGTTLAAAGGEGHPELLHLWDVAPCNLEALDAASELKLAARLSDDGATAQAIERCQEILKLYPRTETAKGARDLLDAMAREPSSTLALARKLIDKGSPQQAAEKLRRIIKRYPGTTAAGEADDLLKPIEESAAASALQSARKLRADGSWRLAEATCREILNSYPRTGAARKARNLLMSIHEEAADRTLQSARKLKAEGSAGQAKAICQEILRLYPQTDAARLAQDLIMSIQEEAAASSLRSARKLKEEGSWRRAKDAYQEVRRLYPRTAAARQALDLLKSIDNEAASSMLQAAQKLSADGSLHPAEGACQDILRLYPQSPAADSARRLLDELKEEVAADEALRIEKMVGGRIKRPYLIEDLQKIVKTYPRTKAAKEAQAWLDSLSR